MNAREAILGRIKEALKILAPPPQKNWQDGTGENNVRACLPAVPKDRPGQIELFKTKCEELHARFELLQNQAEAVRRLLELKVAESWDQIATHRDPLLETIVKQLGLPTLFAEDSPGAERLEKSPVGISGCDALIAQTGSILLSSRSGGGRMLSVLPPHHIVVARQDQMLPDLPAAFELMQNKYRDKYPSFCTFITGPSRTGDIERILVLGAHGPRQLTILFIDA